VNNLKNIHYGGSKPISSISVLILSPDLNLHCQKLSISLRVPEECFVSPMLAISAVHFFLLYLIALTIVQKLFVKYNLCVCTHTHTHTHTYIYILSIYICLCTTTYNGQRFTSKIMNLNDLHCTLVSYSYNKIARRDSLVSPTQVFRQPKKTDIHLFLGLGLYAYNPKRNYYHYYGCVFVHVVGCGGGQEVRRRKCSEAPGPLFGSEGRARRCLY